MGRTILPNKN
ncbi:hypothetical protein CP8484711_2048A, partial [Chlamydia psittaci 84-8471/1]